MKNKHQLSALIFVFFFLISCDQQKNDFDLICQYFDVLEQDKVKDKTLIVDEKSPNYSFTFLNNLITNNITPDSPADMLWQSIVVMYPADSRYIVFEEAVVEAINKPWQCASMKKQLSSVYAGKI